MCSRDRWEGQGGEEGKLTVLVFSPREKLKLQALPWAGGTADLVFK